MTARLFGIRQYGTTFHGLDGNDYMGPLILADCRDTAEAILSCLQGPNGERLMVLGPILQQTDTGNGLVETIWGKE